MPAPSDEPSAHGRCCFDDWADYSYRRANKRGTAAGVTDALLEALARSGLTDRSVLDVGSGVGDLAADVVQRGAERATGMDLSSENVARARQLAAERGVADRTSFEVGDGSTSPLPASDVVVLNRVICCYADADLLVDRSLAAAGSVFAVTAPVSSGPIGMLNRVWNRIGNIWYAIRRERYAGFRTFIHDLDRLDERIRAAGFTRVRHGRSRIVWDLAVYDR